MKGWFILIGFVLLEVWVIWSELRTRKKLKELTGENYPAELKKTSTFGSFFFWHAMALLTLGVVGVICTIGKTLPQLLDACFIGGIFFLPAFVLWYIGFRHDRPKLNAFYENKKQPDSK